MRLLGTLQNPVALVLQGFLVGAIVFFAFQPLARGDRAPPRTSGGSVVATLQAST